MIDRKALTWFLFITFGYSWLFFLLPLSAKNNPDSFQTLIQYGFSTAMWGPGLAAIITTLFIEKKPIQVLRLNSLGPKRFFLWAWLLPPLLTLITLAVTLLLRTGEFDVQFSIIRDAMAKAPVGTNHITVNQAVMIQLAVGITIAPIINIVFALGEELGWRGFLLPHLLPMGQVPAIIISGLIWGFWHAPTILLFGYNFPQHPYLGVLLMMGGCTLLGTILSWLYLNTKSPWVCALAHGAVNSSPGIALYFLKPGFDTAIAGSLLGISGWISMSFFIAWLVKSKLFFITGSNGQVI